MVSPRLNWNENTDSVILSDTSQPIVCSHISNASYCQHKTTYFKLYHLNWHISKPIQWIGMWFPSFKGNTICTYWTCDATAKTEDTRIGIVWKMKTLLTKGIKHARYMLSKEDNKELDITTTRQIKTSMALPWTQLSTHNFQNISKYLSSLFNFEFDMAYLYFE